MIHLDETPLVVGQDDRLVFGEFIQGDVVVNGTIASHLKYGGGSRDTSRIIGNLHLNENSVIEVGLGWSDTRDQVNHSYFNLNQGALNELVLDGTLKIILEEQAWFDGDEAIQILDTGSDVSGAFNQGAERIFTEDFYGSFKVEVVPFDGIYLTDFQPFHPARGDLNRDGETDDIDLQRVLANLGAAVDPGSELAGDWDGDGFVTYKDANAVIKGWTDPAPPAIPEHMRGDLNGDGAVTNGDISAFVQALTDPTGYASEYPELDPQILGDFTGDGQLTNGDIKGFVDALTSHGIDASSIPEPGSLILMGLGGMLFARRRGA